VNGYGAPPPQREGDGYPPDPYRYPMQQGPAGGEERSTASGLRGCLLILLVLACASFAGCVGCVSVGALAVSHMTEAHTRCAR
jgi:hypothetical protein